jgi:hypothetical protein
MLVVAEEVEQVQLLDLMVVQVDLVGEVKVAVLLQYQVLQILVEVVVVMEAKQEVHSEVLAVQV